MSPLLFTVTETALVSLVCMVPGILLEIQEALLTAVQLRVFGVPKRLYHELSFISWA